MTQHSALANADVTSCPCSSDSLILRGDDPVEIHVRMEDATPQFSQDCRAWYNSICWECRQDEQYALIISYHLHDKRLELKPSAIEPTLYFSPVISNKTHNRQIGYLPWASVLTIFHINVSDQVHQIDPEIIVTPIEGDDGNE